MFKKKLHELDDYCIFKQLCEYKKKSKVTMSNALTVVFMYTFLAIEANFLPWGCAADSVGCSFGLGGHGLHLGLEGAEELPGQVR